MRNWLGWEDRGKPFIVAELCTNLFPYNRIKLLDMCSVASDAGADAVKIQLYFAEHFPEAERAAKQETVFPRAELGFLKHCAKINTLAWGASVFDRSAVDLLVSRGADFLKLATREEHNVELRKYANRKFKGTILRSIRWPYGPGPARLPREVTLACIPEYPTDTEWALDQVPSLLPQPWGWSSHTIGRTDCMLAAGYGAAVVEKHLYLHDADLEAGHSLDGAQFKELVKQCKAWGRGG